MWKFAYLWLTGCGVTAVDETLGVCDSGYADYDYSQEMLVATALGDGEVAVSHQSLSFNCCGRAVVRAKVSGQTIELDIVHRGEVCKCSSRSQGRSPRYRSSSTKSSRVSGGSSYFARSWSAARSTARPCTADHRPSAV